MKHDPQPPIGNMIPGDVQALGRQLQDLDGRLSALEKYAVSKNDVHTAVLQWLTLAIAAIVGTVVILNASGVLA